MTYETAVTRYRRMTGEILRKRR